MLRRLAAQAAWTAPNWRTVLALRRRFTADGFSDADAASLAHVQN
jgi:hypothetical protein